MIPRIAVNLTMLMAFFASICFSQECGKANETNSPDIQASTGSSFAIEKIWFGNSRTYRGQSDANGLACELIVASRFTNLPMCEIIVNNTTKKTFHNYWKYFPTNYLKIELFDSTGMPVKKTITGESYGVSLTEGQLNEIYHSKKSWRLTKINPSENYFGNFSIPELFEVKQSGEYTLKVQMRLIQVWPEFKTAWLPELVSKIQIQTTDKPK